MRRRRRLGSVSDERQGSVSDDAGHVRVPCAWPRSCAVRGLPGQVVSSRRVGAAFRRRRHLDAPFNSTNSTASICRGFDVGFGIVYSLLYYTVENDTVMGSAVIPR